MRKVLVATHGRFAEGIRETMQFIMGDEGTVDVLNAYTSQEFDMHKEAERLVNNLGAGDELIVAADLFGGSVANAFVQYMPTGKVHVVTGVNLPMLIELAASAGGELSAEDLIETAIQTAKEGIVYSNKILSESANAEEDDFLMFKLLRLDERLIHGQVAFAWTNSLSADCILVANDGVAKDKLRATSLKLAAPAEVKFVVKSVEDAIKALNGHKTDKYKLFILVDNTKDALALVSAVEEVDHVNLGNMKVKEGTKTWTPSVSVTAEDVENIKGMIEHGAEVECRAVPTDKKVMAETLL